MSKSSRRIEELEAILREADAENRDLRNANRFYAQFVKSFRYFADALDEREVLDFYCQCNAGQTATTEIGDLYADQFYMIIETAQSVETNTVDGRIREHVDFTTFNINRSKHKTRLNHRSIKVASVGFIWDRHKSESDNKFHSKIFITELGIINFKEERRGHGSRLLQKVVQYARKKDIDLISGELFEKTCIGKDNLIKFYETNGFTVKGGSFELKLK